MNISYFFVIFLETDLPASKIYFYPHLLKQLIII